MQAQEGHTSGPIESGDESVNCEINKFDKVRSDIPTQAQEHSVESLQFPPSWSPVLEPKQDNHRSTQTASHKESSSLDGEGEATVKRLLRAAATEEAPIDKKDEVVETRGKGGLSKVGSGTQFKGRLSKVAKHKKNMSKRMVKRREREQLQKFLKDLHSPSSEKNTYQMDCRVTRRKKQIRNEAEEVVKLGEDLGLTLAVPIESAVRRVEEMLESKIDRREEVIRGEEETNQ